MEEVGGAEDEGGAKEGSCGRKEKTEAQRRRGRQLYAALLPYLLECGFGENI